MRLPTRSNAMDDIHRSLVTTVAACGLALLFAAPAHADDESPWSDDARSAVRLIAGSNRNTDSSLRAGIQSKMQPGWKTYWPYPGNSGVPPQFDFSGPENLRAAKVLYPAPHRFTDESGQSLGYKDRVIFPLVISPQNPGKPVRLRL